MAFLIGGANSAAADDAGVANSCRFNDGDSDYLNRSWGSGNQKTWTFSVWVKRSTLGTEQHLFGQREDDSNRTNIFFTSGDLLNIRSNSSAAGLHVNVITNQVFRDVSAWYHIVVAVDTEQGTAANRVKTYVNGTQVTSFGTATYPAEDATLVINNAVAHEVGSYDTSAGFFDGYMAEVVWIDGTQYAASNFGEFDSDSPTIWKPKDSSDIKELTFGTNGFYLDFEDSSNLGNDANGGTDWTEYNLAATNQTTDTPSNNFCTMNPLASQSGSNASSDVVTFAEGNLDLSAIISESAVGTIGVAAGKWYWEVKVITTQDGIIIGGCNEHFHLDAELGYESPTSETGAKIFGYYGSNGNSFIAISDGTSQSYGAAINSNNNIIGVALDVDSADQTCTFYLNGSTQGSLDITNLDVGEFYFPAVGNWSASACAFSMNFGNPTYANSSSVADENGYGAFEYAPPSGYLALCTKNLGSDGG